MGCCASRPLVGDNIYIDFPDVQPNVDQRVNTETADVTTTQQQDSESSKFDKLLTPVQDLQPRIYSIFRTLMRLEEKHMNCLRQAEEYQARTTEDKTLINRELDVIFGDTQSLLSIQDIIIPTVKNCMEKSSTHSGVKSSLLNAAATYWRLCETFKKQALNWLARRSFTYMLTRRHPEMVELLQQCEDAEMLLPLDKILTLPLQRVTRYDEIFCHLQEMAASAGMTQEASSLEETRKAISAVIESVKQVDDLSRRFEGMWKTTLVIHNVKNASLKSNPTALIHHATAKWQTIPDDVIQFLNRHGIVQHSVWEVHCFLFETLLITICIVDKMRDLFYGHVYPLSYVAINSIHECETTWTVYRYDVEYCELTLSSSTQEDKWMMINLIREKARLLGYIMSDDEDDNESDEEFVDQAPPLQCRHQLQLLMKELVTTEVTYVKNLDLLMNTYLLPLRAEKVLTVDETNSICSNIEQIVAHQRVFLKALETAFYQSNDSRQAIQCICAVFNANSEHFKLYTDYIVGLSQCNNVLVEKHLELEKFVTKKRPSEQHALSLPSLLITPFQRLLRYPLIIKSAISCTKSESGWQKEMALLEETVAAIEAICRDINEKKRKKDN
ncbi:uncharacterized protein LOC134183961 [Corticium candelabrum]|uniref:uncharacterized protein LOC134183961 n=1 Tax=Corticium candelabrum TaxID=121492 RepID=UPI002E264430|nr:uncharacterized protein LOC134183961 [Corticium candelabrum]